MFTRKTNKNLILIHSGLAPRRGGSRNLRKGAGPSRSLSLPFFSPFQLSLPFLSPLGVGPLKSTRGSVQRCKLL